jgi:hypothetical protein
MAANATKAPIFRVATVSYLKQVLGTVRSNSNISEVTLCENSQEEIILRILLAAGRSGIVGCNCANGTVLITCLKLYSLCP